MDLGSGWLVAPSVISLVQHDRQAAVVCEAILDDLGTQFLSHFSRYAAMWRTIVLRCSMAGANI